MCLLYLNSISTGFSFEVLCVPSLLRHSNLHRVFSTTLSFCSSSYLFRASSAFDVVKTFEVGLRSLELYFQASSAFDVFETGFRSLELSLSGQQRLRCIRDIRGRTSVPRIVFSGQQRLRDIRGGTFVPRAISFGPTVPSRYSRQALDLLNCFFRSNNTFREFGFELRTFESFSSNLSSELSMLLNQHA
jgi:hypothetical protein